MDQYVHELSALDVAQDGTLIPADDGTTSLKKLSLLQVKSYINQETLSASYPELVGIVFSTGSAAIWTEGLLWYENTSYVIPAGSTTQKYVYWDADTPNGLSTSNTPPEGGENCFTIAYYDAATDSVIELRSSLVFEGDRIVVSNIDLDTLADGDTYAKVLKTSISAGKILLTEATGSIDDIADGSYGKILKTDISAGHITLSSCTGTLDTATQLAETSISPGKILLSSVNTSALNNDAEWTDDATANTALSTAQAKPTVTRSTSQPGSPNAGDIWIDTANGDLPYTWSGSLWVRMYTQIDGGNILTGTLDAAAIKTSTLSADLTTTGILAFKDGSDVTQVQIDGTNGLRLKTQDFGSYQSIQLFTPALNQHLIYDGSRWTNRLLQASDIPQHAHDYAASN
ncbi:MAG: hypothetical protein ACYC3W_11795, partial [Candidatus Nanopelagicales bacterium]